MNRIDFDISTRFARSMITALAALSLGACSFEGVAAPVPTYTCHGGTGCTNATCIEGVCASPTAAGLTLILRTVAPSTASVAGIRTYTYAPFVLDASGTRDLALPPSHSIYGTVRFSAGGTPVAAQVSLIRDLAVAGRFVDDVRVVAPAPASAPDGGAADYRVEVAETESYLAVVVPTSSLAAAMPGLPPALLGLPLDQVFPPTVQRVSPSENAALGSTRVDFSYPTSLFNSCVGSAATACTASGRVVSMDDTGSAVPEAGLRVVLESMDSSLAVSTVATTDASGAFSIRISSTLGPTRLRISSSESRGGFPDLALVEDAFDPHLGGDVMVPAFSVVRYVGRVEFAGRPVAYALVRAIAQNVTSAAGVDILGAEFRGEVRTTSAGSTDGAGIFTLDLVEGDYDFVVSDSETLTSVARAAGVVALPAGGGVQQGQTFTLAPLVHLGGVVTGPDETPLPYSTLQVLPFATRNASTTASASARAAATNSDAAGQFDLAADQGSYDLLATNSLAEGLPAAVFVGLTVGGPASPPWLPIRFTRAAVLAGRVTTDGRVPIPESRVEAYLLIRGDTSNLLDRMIALGNAIADTDGHYRLLLPSSYTQ